MEVLTVADCPVCGMDVDESDPQSGRSTEATRTTSVERGVQRTSKTSPNSTPNSLSCSEQSCDGRESIAPGVAVP
jgi:hypothetical protein